MGKYILQYGSLAGWPYLFAAGLRAAGYRSSNVIPQTQDFEDLDRRLPFDRAIAIGRPSRLDSLYRRGRFLIEAAKRTSLVHYHGSVILGSRSHPWIEGRLFRALDIPMLISFGGSEGRIIGEARRHNPYFYLEEDSERDERTHRFLHNLSRTIRFVATDQEMATYARPYFEHVFLLRQPVDTSRIKFVRPRIDRPPVFLHVPTNVLVKGTEFILAAFERLKNEGAEFELRVKRQLTQSEFYAEIADCDVYVDELRCGAHGVTAVETMAAGKPTITYIRPDLVAAYPDDLPLVNANPDTIYDCIRALVDSSKLRVDLAYASRRYVEKYHDLKVVTDDLLKIYESIGMMPGTP